MSEGRLSIISVTPSAGVPGGEISIQCIGFEPGLPGRARVLFGETPASIVSASPERVVAKVPDHASALGVSLCVDGKVSPVYPFMLAMRLASDLHPVTNPVMAPDGTIVTTVSGARGQQSAQPLVRISRRGEVTSFSVEIMNPTGLAFGPDGQLYVSSRADGTILRYADFEHVEVVAEDLGVPCGIAFDRQGTLFVGDRMGRIIRLDLSGNRSEFAILPPSISAYHLALDAEGNLYVTGPTLAMRDPVYRISPSGTVTIVLEGLARPQGIAIGPEGDLWMAAAFGGRKGIFRYSFRTGTLEHAIAGPMLVGLALDQDGIFLADGGSIYWVQTGSKQGKYS